MKIGIFEIPERVIFPRTHKEMQRQLQGLAASMGLDLKFVERKKSSSSYCDPLTERAVVVAKLKSRRYSMLETTFFALHEIGHWMDFNNGLFQDYYARRGYKHVIGPTDDNILRLGVRAEQHCDWLAHRMLWVMYGKAYNTPHVYDNVAQARQSLIEHYNIESQL